MALTLSEFVTNYEGKKSDHETEQKGNLVPYATRCAAITQPKVSLLKVFLQSSLSTSKLENMFTKFVFNFKIITSDLEQNKIKPIKVRSNKCYCKHR